MRKRFLLSCLLSVTWMATEAVAFELTELDRFEARLPISLEYSMGTCTLWLSGNTHITQRVTLNGKRVEVRNGVSSISFTAFSKGKLLGVEYDGDIIELTKNGPKHWGRVESGNNTRIGNMYVSGENITGGDMRSDGSLVISLPSSPYLNIFATRYNPLSVRVPGKSGSFRGVAYDQVFDRTFALLRSRKVDELIVFDGDFEIVASQILSSWGLLAEGIAVQPETGDIFVSFMQNASIKGEVVRFSVDGLDTEGSKLRRPTYVCATS